MSTLLSLLRHSTEFGGFVGFSFLPIAMFGIFGAITFSAFVIIIVKAVKSGRSGGIHHKDVMTTNPYARPEAKVIRSEEEKLAYCEYCGAVVSKGKEHCDSCGAARQSK